MTVTWRGPSVTRRLPDADAADLLSLTVELAQGELAPRVEQYEAEGRFPREVFRTLGEAGLLGLPFPEELGGAGQPYEVYLQVLEELSRAWLSVGIGVSVHALASFAMVNFGSAEQQALWTERMLGGSLLGAYCLSEPHSGSDAAALSTRAVRDGDDYVVTGSKAWITHGGQADFYTVMVRTSDDGAKGISCLLVEPGLEGFRPAEPERKMGAGSSHTAQLQFEGARVPVAQRIGDEGRGFPMALAALDAGRLGIAACAIGLAQAALDEAVAYARQRQQFGRSIADFQGVSFMLADMATQVAASRALTLEAARMMDAGESFGAMAAMAKLQATDTAMKVTTNAVQVLGGAGYTQDFPAERYFREAKVLQIVEGTNQVQRMVIGRALTGQG